MSSPAPTETKDPLTEREKILITTGQKIVNLKNDLNSEKISLEEMVRYLDVFCENEKHTVEDGYVKELTRRINEEGDDDLLLK